MPVGNEIFRGKLPSHALEGTHLCRKCGYDLKGLTTDARCPECGTSIKGVKSRRRLGDTITDAPADYLNYLTMSCWVGFVTLIAAIGAWMAALRWDDVAEVRLIWALCCSGWASAVFMLTADRRSLVSSPEDLRNELRICRWIARISQIGWVIAALLSYFQTRALMAANPGIRLGPGWAVVPASVEMMRALAWFMLLAAMTGIGFLCLHLASLAYWGRDEKLEMRFRTCTYFLCGGVPLLLLGFALRDVPSLIGYFAFGMMLVMGALVFAGWALFLLSLVQLATLSVWAVASAAAEAARDNRMLEKAEAERARAVERDFSAPAPVDLRPAADASRPLVKPKGAYVERPRDVEGYEVKE